MLPYTRMAPSRATATEGDATILRFTHSGLRARDAMGYIPGEHAFLDRLEAHLGGAGLPVWTERYAEVKSAYGA